jgi:predicted porin
MFKKNLIAVAGLAVLASAAQAQVTLYGNLDIGVAHSRVKVAGDSESVNSVDSSLLTESYFGLKGSEDLGGGLKALFVLESPVGLDTGTASGDTFWGRNAYVGLAGGFGTVKLGNQESLFKTEGAAFNPFGSSPLFSTTNLVTDLSGLGGSWQHAVGYTSTNMSGLTVSAQYSAKEGAKGDAVNYSGGAYALAANYAAGPLALSATYGNVKTTDASPTDEKQRAYLLGASYDFGVAKAFAQYGRDKFSFKDGSDDVTAKFYQIGALVPVTAAGSVHVSYGRVKAEGDKDTQVSLAYNHSLSKRTGAYVGITRVKSELNVEAVERATVVAVGVRHAF